MAASVEITAPRVQDKEAAEKFLKNQNVPYTLHFLGSGKSYRIFATVPDYWEFYDQLNAHLKTYKHVQEAGHNVKILECK